MQFEFKVIFQYLIIFSKYILMKKNIIILFIIFILVVCSLYNLEKNDVLASNKYYNYIKKNNECLEYLQTINQIPTWRLSFMCALFITFLNSFIIVFVLCNKKLSPNSSFWLIITFMVLINFIGIYKLLGHWNWHYMCDWGCSKHSIGKWK